MSNYTAENIERGLTFIVAANGNARLASRMLEDAGHDPIPFQTLDHWRRVSHAQRYSELADVGKSEIAKRTAAEAEEIVARAAELERTVLDQLATALEEGKLDPKDLASSLRNITTTKSLNQDRIANPLRDRPNIRIEHHDYRAVLVKYGGSVIDVDGEEIHDAPSLTPGPAIQPEQDS